MSTEKVEQLCTTLWVYKTTRARLGKHKGRGISWDRYLNDLQDLALQDKTKYEQKEKD